MYFVISCSVIVLIIFGSQYFIYLAPNINYHVPGKYLLYEEIVSGLYEVFFFNILNRLCFSCALCGGHNWSPGLQNRDSGAGFHKIVSEFLIRSLGEHSLFPEVWGGGVR